MANKIFEMSKDGKSEYCVDVVRVGELIPIEGSDFLAQTFIGDASIVVRKDLVSEGQLLFYVSNECQINKRFLSVNNLFEIGSRELNSNGGDVEELLAKAVISRKRANNAVSDEDRNKYLNEEEEYKKQAKSKCGFFPHNGRVRMIRLRKTPSMGYLFGVDEMAKFCPKVKDVNLEDYLNVDFDTVDGELFVKAYVPPVKEPSKRGDKSVKRNKKLNRFDRMIPGEFSYHYDTGQLGKNMQLIKPSDVVDISTKCHGCVREDTIVDTLEYGKVTIGEIVNHKKECHIKSFDTEVNEVVYVPIDNFYLIPNDGEWYELELENGIKITITGNNPIYIPSIGAYRRVDELCGDEYLLFTD